MTAIKQVIVKKVGARTLHLPLSLSLNIKAMDSSNIVSDGCYDYGRNCIDCIYLKEKGEYFYSYVTKRQYKVGQNVNCLSKNVIYLVTCKKCKKKGVGKTIDFKSRMVNYRSCIKNKKISCNVNKHFIEETNHSVKNFDVQIIVQSEKVQVKDQARKRIENSLKGIGKLYYARWPHTD